MGLISEYVEVVLSGSNVSYYKNLGYKIPTEFDTKKNKYIVKRGTKILVKVSDLQPNSQVLVDVSCDNCSKEYKKSYAKYNTQNHDGKTYCQSCVMSVLYSGENHHLWNDNKTQEEREVGRNYPEYTEFIKSVLARDNYTCQCCGKERSDIEVHHLYGYSGFPQYRIDQTQALTLCRTCHQSFHNWHVQKYGFENKGNCTREQYEEWFGDVVEKLQKYNGELQTAKRFYCYEDDCVYDSITKYAKSHNISPAQIYRVCNKESNTCQGKHYMWHDEYVNMSKIELKEYFENVDIQNRMYGRKVICITTMKIFNSLNEAGEYYNFHPSGITYQIKGRQDYAGKLSDGTLLQWMYYVDYLEKVKNNEEILITPKIFTLKSNATKIICITTGKIFLSLREINGVYKVNRGNVSKVCKGELDYAGKLSDGTPLEWMYYEDFLKLPQEEQNEILERNKDSSTDGSFIDDKNNESEGMINNVN